MTIKPRTDLIARSESIAIFIDAIVGPGELRQEALPW